MTTLPLPVKDFLEKIMDLKYFHVLNPETVQLKSHPEVSLFFSLNTKKGLNCTAQIEGLSFKGDIENPKTVKHLAVLLDDYLPFPDVSETTSQQLADVIHSECLDTLPLKAVSNGQTIYLISEEMYQYFANKCLKHEVYDTGFYGRSESHTVATPFSLKGFQK